MPIKHKILPKYKLIIEYFYGDITIDDIIEAKKGKNALPNFDANFNHLIDLRKANFKVDVNDISSVSDFQHANKQFIQERKSALLTESPEHASLTTLFTMSMKGLPIEFEIFTTLDGTLSWLELWDFNEENYNEIVETL